MKNNLNSLAVDSLIVHDVPKKFSKRFIKENPEADLEDLILSDVPTAFDTELVRFFHDRIAATIGSSSAFEIEFDPELSDNKTQIAVKSFFETGNSASFPVVESEAIRITQDIAKELHSVQTAKNPGGILLFIPCHSQQKYGLAILKVEREEGVRIQRDTTEQGKTTFSAQHIKDLLLTSKTKLFKIVLFYQKDDNIIGYVCDQQQGVIGNREVANFFLTDFLGCKLKEEPHVTTKKFFEAATNYINGNQLTDSEKLYVRTHLISELTNNLSTVNVLAFAQRALPPDKIQNFMDEMNQKNIPTSFNKNNVLISEKIKHVKYELECGIKITGTEEAVKNNLTIAPIENGKTRFELIDRIRKVE